MKGLVIKATMTAVCALSTLGVAVAQDAEQVTPEKQAQQAVELRQSVFKLMGWSMGPVGAMARNRMPFDAAVAQKSAERIEQLSTMIADTFTLDTRQFKSIKTESLDGIWNSKQAFADKATDLQKAAQALSAAAKSGDKAATLKAAGAVGKACGSCHDDFRLKK